MALIDEVEIHAAAGRGGDGVVRWRHEKGREFGGPSGGNGGTGGDVYAVAVRDIAVLRRYRTAKVFSAADGENGKKNSKNGQDGKDLEILLPEGSVITNKETGEVHSLDHEGQRILLLKGGNGGRGNESFKSSRNRSPEEYTEGESGEEADLHIELQLIADIGLIGMPSAGKSTCLNALTRAEAKTAAYHFTTLEPNLGVCFGVVLVDIPGLIEGAAKGKGLGHQFLRHIKRTRMLAHLVSLENEDVVEAYQTIRKEIGEYSPELLSKPEIIVLTKTDMASDKEAVSAAVKALESQKKTVLAVSFTDEASVKAFRDTLLQKFGALQDQQAA